MSTPPHFTVSDLVPLMYRAHWAGSGYSGEVRTRESRSGSGAASGTWEQWGSLEVDPDGQYRAEVTHPDGERDLLTGDVGGPVPFAELTHPSLLLPDFDLRITGRAEFIGRDAIAIAGSRRLAGLLVGERVSGLVDAELGVLLRFQRLSRGHDDSAEFTRLTVGSPGPGRREPPPQQAPGLTDAEVNLLYRSDLGPQRFCAELSEQADVVTMMRLARESFAATKAGSRTRWLWRPSDDRVHENVDLVARLAVAMPGSYLIEEAADPGDRPARIVCDGQRLWRAYSDYVAVRDAEPPPRGIAAIVDPAWLLRDPGQVSVLGDAVVAGRPAMRVMVTTDPRPTSLSPLSGKGITSDQVEVFIDRALGICLRQVGYYQEHPVLRTELTGLTTEFDQSVFEYEPPPGTKVITGGLLAEAGQSPAHLALQLGKGAAALAAEVGRRWLSRNDTSEPPQAPG